MRATLYTFNWSFFFLTSLLEYNCFTMLCQFLLYNKVNQLYIYICPYIPSLLHLSPTLPIPPLQVVTKHRADLPVLCSCFPLAIYFTFGSVYMSKWLYIKGNIWGEGYVCVSKVLLLGLPQFELYFFRTVGNDRIPTILHFFTMKSKNQCCLDLNSF